MNPTEAKQYNPQEGLCGEVQSRKTLPWAFKAGGSYYIHVQALAAGLAALLVVWWLW